jgi:DNA-binding NarL/FixJ family response regulator
MDVRMPEMDGIEATRRICGAPETADVRVLILTMFGLDSYVFSALRAGAGGFLLKDTPPTVLLDAIRVVAAGDGLLAPAVTRRRGAVSLHRLRRNAVRQGSGSAWRLVAPRPTTSVERHVATTLLWAASYHIHRQMTCPTLIPSFPRTPRVWTAER